VTHIKPISETPESVTLSRADFEAMIEELEDAEDQMAVLRDCLLDEKQESSKYNLSMADTMRIIDGANPIMVWREKRGLSVRELADKLGLRDGDLEAMERGGAVSSNLLHKLAQALEVFTDQLKHIAAAP